MQRVLVFGHTPLVLPCCIVLNTRFPSNFKVKYITYTMAAWDLPEIYALSPRACFPLALGVYFRQIPYRHGVTITYLITVLVFIIILNEVFFSP